MLVAAIVITPLGIRGAIPAMGDMVALAAGIGVGLSSSVIPYVFDQLAMARLARSTYSLFVALLPATAVLIGIIVLQQVPTWLEVAGVGFVIGGVLTHHELPARQSGCSCDRRQQRHPTPAVPNTHHTSTTTKLEGKTWSM
jgi:inner membrane transporter RhtA